MKLLKSSLFLTAFALIAQAAAVQRASAGEAINSISEVGQHYGILTFEKSVNPQNIMIVYTKLDQDCHVVREQNHQPLLDFYWMMDRKSYKPVNGLIKNGIRDRLSIESGGDGSTSFAVRVNDLDAVKHDLKDSRLLVRATETSSGCSVQGLMNLGPSDGNAQIRLDTIYSDAEVSGFSAKIKSVTLKGKNVKTGKSVSRTFMAK